MFINPREEKAARKRMEHMSRQLIVAQQAKDVKTVQRLSKELTALTMKLFRQSLKALIPSLTIVLVVVVWLSHAYGNATIKLPFALPLVGSTLGWLGWYILASIASAWILKRLLGW
jgi:uncharacterized membrane protein (DUF106 family)